MGQQQQMGQLVGQLGGGGRDPLQEQIDAIKAHMPQTYRSIRECAGRIGNEAYALVRRGLRGEAGWLVKHEGRGRFQDHHAADEFALFLAQGRARARRSGRPCASSSIRTCGACCSG